MDLKNTNINNNVDEAIVFPASYAQRRLWFFDQFEPGSPYYNIPMAVRLKGPFRYDILEKTINEIIKRHEILRTTFASIDGEPVQVISEPYELDIPVIEVSGSTKNEIEDKIYELARIEARKPFNLKELPLIRLTVLRIGEKDNVLLLTMHHIISDGWSMGILVNEITTLYRAFYNGEENPLPELEIQYADFSEWQHEYLKGEVLQKQLDYWKEQLGDIPPVLELPTDRPRPNIWTNEGASFTEILPPAYVDKLKQVGYKEGATLFMTLVAAFDILLSKYSGQKDIAVGTPIANRTLKETEPLIGMFINTLVLRNKIEYNKTFREFLREVKDVNLKAFENQDVPFELIVDELQPDRDMSYSPLFQVMFILQNAPVKATVVPELELSTISVDMGTATSDITFSLSEGVNGISISVEYNTDLFDESTVRRMVQHYKNIVIEISNNINIKIKDIRLLSNEELHKILYEWNNKKIERPLGVGIHQLFEKNAVNTPDAIAVVDTERSLTYYELNKRANKIAHRLIKLGAGPDKIIGILLDKSVDLMASVLGVLKSGSAYLPVDPTYPQEKIDYMLDDSRTEIIITESLNAELLKEKKLNILYLDSDSELIEHESDSNPDLTLHDKNLAYMIYTSGSTGKSKGTMIQHESIVNAYLAWELDYNLLTGARNHLQMASFSFDVFTGDWTRALCSGGKLVLVPRSMLLDAESLYNLMIKEQINIAEFVPAVLRNLIQYVEEKKLKLDFFNALIAGSDIWYVNEYRKIKSFCGGNTRLINSFGLTEATIDSTFFEAEELNIADEKLVPIGKPFANMPIYILDEFLNPVPVGVRGELFVGGIGVARGYFNRPGLTAERFVPNPFALSPGERMYRTGDVARYLPDGNIEFLGRKDHQIKLRGYRIELGEIETAIGKYSNIKDSVVIAREDKPGDKKLVAYIVPENKAEIDLNNLREFLLTQLPDYMVPSAIMILDELPLTPNGKVDRKALPVPGEDLFKEAVAVDYVAPRNQVEEVIAKIWSDVLHIDVIGIYNNFFLLGGHSLLATQVVSRIKKHLGVEIPLRSIFENPTIAGLAKAVEKEKLAQRGIKLPEIRKIPREGKLPLSFAQQRLWFLEQLEPGTPFYNIPETYRISGDLNTDALEKAINKVIERHETLRTSFHSENGVPYVVIEPELKFDLNIVELTGLNGVERENRIKEIIKEENSKPVPLEKPPLFRAKLLKLSESEYVIVLVIHHIISDDWSTKVLMQEISIIYESIVKNVEYPLPELKIQYVDYAAWQKEWLSGKVLEEQINYWKNTLSDIPPVLDLPTDRPRPAVQTFNGSYLSFELPGEIGELISKISKEEGVTSFMILLAAFDTLLSKYSGQEDIIVGTPVANRTQDEVENLIGFFVNTLVLRTDLSGNPTFRDLLKRVRETSLGAYAHQDLPFEQVVDLVQPERSLSHSPIFQVMFTLQNTPKRERSLSSGITISSVAAHSGTSKFDLTMFMVGEGKHYGGALEFNTDLFDESTIASMIDRFKKILFEMLSHPDKKIGDVSLMSEDESKNLIALLNSTEEINQPVNTFVDEFYKTASKFAKEKAVVINNNEFTYGQLNKDSNRLARYLQSLGVKQDSLVGVYMNRSYEMIVSLIGIMKAGGAYLPLEPQYPPERIKYMIEDSACQIVLTTPELSNKINNISSKIIEINNLFYNFEQFDDTDLNIKIMPENLVYVIYTSGSTGKPKGTLLTHRGLANYLNWCLHAYPVDKGIGSVVHSTFAFDATVTALYPVLLTGKAIYLVDNENELDGLKEILTKHKKFSLVKITPAHLEVLANLLEPPEAKHVTASFIIGGENLTTEQIKFWQRNAGDTLLFNEYGPTETVVGCVVYEASGYKGKGSVPIGKVIPGATIYVLDKFLNPVPEGIPGELYIGGVGVARAYLDKPDLTAEKFIPDPFSSRDGQRMYKTGDLVKILPGGNLEFIGRIDDQVKVRGYRIELGEIEEAIRNLSMVSEAVVVLKANGKGEEILAAYVVPNSGLSKEKLIQDIKNSLGKVLPEYMIPPAVVVLDELPLTVNGKIDRKKLPDVEFNRNDVKTEFVEAKTKEEKTLVGIWKELLGIENIGIKDNFFDLGGHSLIVTQMISRIREEFGIELPVRKIFENPTIENLSFAIQNENRVSSIPPLKRAERNKPIPLSFNQQRIWFLEKLNPGQTIYNMQTAVKISGELSFENFEKSVREVIRKHETLRTVFREVDGIPHQVILDEIDSVITTINITGEGDKQYQVKQELLKDAKEIFDLEKGPLFRIKVINTGENENVIAVTMHHIISDGWSINILMSELIRNYLELRKNPNYTTEPLEIQYADYSVWQRDWLKDEMLEKEIEFWKNELKGAPPLLELPLDKKRPPVKTFNGSHLSFNFDEELGERLIEFCAERNVTPFMFLVTTFNILLSKYSNQKDIVIGTPIANRNRKELEKIIGFFANTVVLRTRIKSGITFEDLLQQVKENTLRTFAHQELPFEKLVEELQVERELSYTPVFQVMFVLQNNKLNLNVDTENKIIFSPVESQSTETQFDLTLSMYANENKWGGTFEFNTDLFYPGTIEKMIRHFEQMVKSVVNNPLATVPKIDLLTAEEKNKLLAISKGESRTYEFENVLDRFEKISNECAGNVALRYNNVNITYTELNKLSNSFANHLIAEGINKEEIVGVMTGDPLQTVISMLGIMKAGAVYLPVDKNYPEERIKFMISDSGIRFLVYDGKIDEHYKNLKIINPGEIIKNQSTLPGNNIPVNIEPDNLAYMIYTSGSTGQPKGTVIPHKGLNNLTYNQIRDFSVTGNSKVLQFASFGFDASISEIFMALLSGATLVMIDNEVKKDIDKLIDVFNKEEITTVTLPPTLLNILPPDKLQTLETIISAGEKLTVEIANKWKDKVNLINAYGPTESSVGVTCYRVEDLSGDWGSVPIGKAIDNVEVYILDDELNLVPQGVTGEICIAGDGLARGYWNKPELTAEKFVPNIYGKGKLYKTGDLGKFNRDGVIEFIGRKDEQVKLRGFRLELGEIEENLRSIENIDDAAVVVKDQGTENAKIIAFVVSGNDVKTEDIIKVLRNKLPDFMIPSLIERLDKLPLTPNGKVDKKYLQSIDLDSRLVHKEFVAPRNSAEKQIAGIWKELLKIEQVGIKDNFFELGGHSLLVTQLISRLRDLEDIEIPIRIVFEHPTIEELAAKLELLKKRSEIPPISKTGRNKPVPLSFNQERLWFLDRMEPGNTIYNLPLVVRVKGKFDPGIFQKVINDIVTKHESLRTNIVYENGQAIQKINEPDTFKIEVIKNVNDKDEIQLLVEEFVSQSFDLAKDQLFKVKIFEVNDDEFIVALLMHHIISDGWSINILLQDIFDLYSQYTQNGKANLEIPDIQYADYAAWQREWLKDEVLASEIEFWKNQLSGAPKILDLPTDKERPPVKTFNGDRIQFEIKDNVAARIKKICVENNVTPFMFLLTAFGTLLYRYTGQNDILIGTPIANRNKKELEKIIGYFANTIVMRADLRNNPAFSEALQKIKNNALQAFQHSEIPFEKLVDEIQPERELSYTPLFQVMFVLQNNDVQAAPLSGLVIEPVETDNKTAQFDLTLNMEETPSGFTGWFEFNTDLFYSGTIRKMIQHFQNLIDDSTLNPGTPVSFLRLLSAEEEKQILAAGKGKNVKLSAPSVVYDFENIVQQYENKTAIEYLENNITYKELDEKSSKLAEYLIKNGLQKEDIIAVECKDKLLTIQSMLAVMKAGGVYLPVDSSYPAERKQYIISDSGVNIVITDNSEIINYDNKNIKIIDLIKDKAQIDNNAAGEYKPEIKENDLVYMIYTSGSTGKPKGVMIKHKGLKNLTQAQIKDFGITAESKVLQLASFGFDASISEIFMALLSGATLVLIPDDVKTDTGKLLDVIKGKNITAATIPPSLLSVLPFEKIESFKTIISAGEALPKEVASRWMNGYELINAYGPTESSIGVTSFHVKEIAEEWKSIPIGKPVDNIEIYILDEYGNIVPRGVTGEICIGGIGLARGYFNKPELTAEKFIPNKFGKGRLYKTGDLGRFTKDGLIEFAGRKDSQIKLRGYRIELGEIEENIKSVNGIIDCAVVIQTEAGDDKKLVAFVVSEEEGIERKVRRELRRKLPEYMIPNIITRIKKMPLTPNAKVDRKRLENMKVDFVTREKEYIPPKDDIELKLTGIWQEILKLQKVGVRDNFFEIGGHSILAINLLEKISKDFNIEIPMVKFFMNPTIRNVANQIKIARSGKAIDPNVLVRFHDDEQRKPLYFIHPSGGSVHWYTMLATELKGVLPFYGIQAKGVDGKDEPHESIEEMAAYYVSAIKENQPEGPYLVGSWSMGVVIAYEAARQLLEGGDIVDKLIILDQGPYLPLAKAEDDAEFLAGMFMGRIEFSLEKLRKMTYDEQLKYVLKKAKREKQFPKHIRFKQFKNYVKILKIQQDAWRNYEPLPCDVKVTLIKSMERDGRKDEKPDLGWGELAKKGVEIYQTPGNHNTMLHQPKVKLLAELLTKIVTE